MSGGPRLSAGVEEVPDGPPGPGAGVAWDCVVVPAALHRELMGAAVAPVEVGGFLLGAVEGDGRVRLRVLEALPVASPDATATHFVFPGDSFLAANAAVSRSAGAWQLLGWYHTHPRASGAAVAPSPTDAALHLGTFRRPWQVAVIAGEAEVQAFGRLGEGLVRVPLRVEEGPPPWS